MTETCTSAQLDPNEVTFTHAVTQMYVDLRACFKVQYSVCCDRRIPWPKRDVLLCIISVLCEQCCLCTCFCSERDSPEWTKKSHHPLPQPFDPQSSQLFSITFKLLYTRRQRIDLKVWLSPPHFFLFVFKNAFQYYLCVGQASVQSICYCLSVYVWSSSF